MIGGEKAYRAWHVCPDDMLTVAYPGVPRMPIVEGETIEMAGRCAPTCGATGMHASSRLLDAVEYRRTGRICLVDVWGDVHVTSHCISGRYRRCVRVIPQSIADIECRFFAASVAHRMLVAERTAGREPAQASWDAVEVARQYAVGSVSGSDLESAAAGSARAVAWAAAWAASWAAAAEEASVEMATREELSRELEDRLLRCVEVPR